MLLVMLHPAGVPCTCHSLWSDRRAQDRVWPREQQCSYWVDMHFVTLKVSLWSPGRFVTLMPFAMLMQFVSHRLVAQSFKHQCASLVCWPEHVVGYSWHHAIPA